MMSMSDEIFGWDLVSLLEPPTTPAKPNQDDYALLVLNHPLKNTSIVRALWAKASMRVAADGGANRVYDMPAPPSPPIFDFIVGDLDSIRAQVRLHYTLTAAPGATLIPDQDPDCTDFAKSVRHIRSVAKEDLTSRNIVVLGGLGGRIDQALSVLHHMYSLQGSPTYESGRLYLVGPGSLTVLLKTGRHRLRVRGGPTGIVLGRSVGIAPLKEASVITTHGLKWDVQDWETEIGGRLSTSNEVREGVEVVEIETTKDVLFTVDTPDLIDGAQQQCSE